MTHGAPEILTAAARIASPWKNGGGVTREIAAFPAGASVSDFDWRVSSAEVHLAGSFSAFSDVDRTLCVLEGELVLSVHGQAAVALDVDSAPFTFPGDVPTHGAPQGGLVVDLNVMTRRSRYAARVRRLEVLDVLPVTLEAHTTLIYACTSVVVTVEAGQWTLLRADAVRLIGRGCCTLSAPEGEGDCYLIEISQPGSV